jgi:glycosyltransferase involved in cell wall biosynthesis
LRGVPLVFSLHNQLRLPLRQIWLKRARLALDAAIIRRTDAVLCHGPFLKSELLAIGAPEERVIEFDCGVRDVVAAAGATSPGDSAVTESSRSVLYVGRIVAAKGVFDLLSACRPLLTGRGDLRLEYAGDGPDLPALKEEVRRLALEDRVSFHGHLPHARIGPVMRRAWVVATPTRLALGEARCMTAMEALGLAVPVVAPALGAFPFLIRQGENGMLFEPDNANSLRACLGRLLDDPALYQAVKQGAAASGRALLDPPLTFGAAVARALRLTADEPVARMPAPCASPRGGPA